MDVGLILPGKADLDNLELVTDLEEALICEIRGRSVPNNHGLSGSPRNRRRPIAADGMRYRQVASM